MSTPFDPQPLTPEQQAQVADVNIATQLVAKTLLAREAAKSAYVVALGVSVDLTIKAMQWPSNEVDTGAMNAAEQTYVAAQNLVRNLGYYLGGAQGWRFNRIQGQPGGELYQQLLDRLKGL